MLHFSQARTNNGSIECIFLSEILFKYSLLPLAFVCLRERVRLGPNCANAHHIRRG